jgi:hypothetical protein
LINIIGKIVTGSSFGPDSGNGKKKMKVMVGDRELDWNIKF